MHDDGEPACQRDRAFRIVERQPIASAQSFEGELAWGGDAYRIPFKELGVTAAELNPRFFPGEKACVQ